MPEPVASPEVSHEDQDEEQIDDEQVEQERINIADEEPEDVIEEEVEGEGDVKEEEKAEGQEGLDLDMADEDGMGYQDEPDGEPDVKIADGHGGVYVGDDNYQKVDDGKEAATLQEEERHTYQKEEREETILEKKEDPLSLPPHGSEVFVGGITRDTVEDDLKEMCSLCGEIFEVRIMKDKDKGDNKGFAFVTFTTKESADKAIETLNDHELKGRKLRFSASQSKNRLFVGNIPKVWDKDELQNALAERGPGIVNIELVKDPQNLERNRGFAFIEYYNHACAENARRNLSLPGVKLGPNAPTINWADTRSVPDNASLSQVKVVYVRNLPDDATEEELHKLFEHHGEIEKVMLPMAKPGQSKRDFGFIHFADRSSALKAIEKTEKYELRGQQLEPSLAKAPAEKRPVGFANASFRAGLLPPLYQSRAGFGYPEAGLGLAYYANRGFTQPVIYGRGPAPPGMAMVPMMLPDGRMGYVLQQPDGQGMAAPHGDGREGRGQPSQRHGGAGGGGSRRYRPY